MGLLGRSDMRINTVVLKIRLESINLVYSLIEFDIILGFRNFVWSINITPGDHLRQYRIG